MADPRSNIMERVTEYIHIKMEQFKLKIIASVSGLLANLIAFSLVGVFGVFFIFFLSLGLGFYLNTILDSHFFGHLIVACFYLILISIIFLLVKTNKIRSWFENIILKATEKEDESGD